MEKYSYLKKYINNYTEPRKNLFLAVTLNEIKEAEKKLGFKFPDALKEFWLEIGYGFLATSSKGKRMLDYTNRISDPSQIASIILEEEDAPIISGISEYFEEGAIPFFEVMNSTDFLFMKRNTNKPDMVYDMLGGEIDHFEKFIWRLYYESPMYYETIISKNLENLENKN